MSEDRLQQIKQRTKGRRGFVHIDDYRWLVSEVVRLRGLVPGDTTQARDWGAEQPERPVLRFLTRGQAEAFVAQHPGSQLRCREVWLGPWLAPAAEDGTA